MCPRNLAAERVFQGHAGRNSELGSAHSLL